MRLSVWAFTQNRSTVPIDLIRHLKHSLRYSHAVDPVTMENDAIELARERHDADFMSRAIDEDGLTWNETKTHCLPVGGLAFGVPGARRSTDTFPHL